ncbi:hypothetical protein EST38_g6108 [Candolleomyces aberdarensis]|uniref:Uncharacterized protein n=1 Tax=Candolleomyces aberdarensis TaxID=2316362 RepID=A0A4Q2DLG5_9AGAR|nr:hypothetical protein EST38_g6108 [Candolleomyces aberdarensis]
MERAISAFKEWEQELETSTLVGIVGVSNDGIKPPYGVEIDTITMRMIEGPRNHPRRWRSLDYEPEEVDGTVHRSEEVWREQEHEEEENMEEGAGMPFSQNNPGVEARKPTRQRRPAQRRVRDPGAPKVKLMNPTAEYMKYQPEHYAVKCRHPKSLTDDTLCGELVPLVGGGGYASHLYHEHSYMYPVKGEKGTCPLPGPRRGRCGGIYRRNEMKQHTFSSTAHKGIIEGSRLREFGGDGTVKELPHIVCVACEKRFGTYIGGNDERLRSHITRGECPYLNVDGSPRA